MAPSWVSNNNNNNNNNNNDDLEVAYPQSSSSSTGFLIELEFRNVGFWGEEKTRVTREKPVGAKGENQQQTQPIYGVEDKS